MSKEYTANGDYIITPRNIKEKFTSYINVPDDINTLSNMTIDEIVNIISQLSIIDSASLLSTMSDTPENILRVSQILLMLPLENVYSIIPTMMEQRSNMSTSIIVLILLNMPISTIALIIANMKIPQLLTIPVTFVNKDLNGQCVGHCFPKYQQCYKQITRFRV